MTDEVKSELTEDQKKAQEEVEQHYRDFKKKLKIRSKSELIHMLWELGIQNNQMRYYIKNKLHELKRNEQNDKAE